MFRNISMKKTSLKAKNQNASSNSSKQMKLDKFFVKKQSPNKENLKDDHSHTADTTPFLCLSDAHGDESVIDSSIAILKETVSNNKKPLTTKGDIITASSPRNNKRKSSGSLELKATSQDESCVESSLKETDVITNPKNKKINLDSISTAESSSSISRPKRNALESSSDEKFLLVTQEKNPESKRISMCLTKQSKSVTKSSSKPGSNFFNAESPPNCNVSSSSNKESPLHEGSKKSQSPGTGKGTSKRGGNAYPKSTPKRREKPKPDTPYPLLKPATNITSVLFESVRDCKVPSDDAKPKDDHSFLDSNIESALKPQIKSATSESSSVYNISRCTKKKSHLNEGSHGLQSSGEKKNISEGTPKRSGNDTLKSTPKRREKPKPDTPYPLLKTASNNTSILFESARDEATQSTGGERNDSCSLSDSDIGSTLKSKTKKVISEGHLNCKAVRRSNMDSLSDDKNKESRSPGSELNSTKCTPKRREKPKPDTPYPFLKPSSNATSKLSESIEDFQIQSKDSKLNAHRKLPGSNIESALKSRAIFSKLKAHPKPAAVSSQENLQQACIDPTTQPHENQSTTNKTILNSSVPLFEDTPLKSCKILAKDVSNVEKLNLSESSPMFMDSQHGLNRKFKNHGKESRSSSFCRGSSSDDNTPALFDSPLQIEPFIDTPSLSKTSFPSIISRTIANVGTILPTPPNTPNFGNGGKMSPINQLKSKIVRKDSCSSMTEQKSANVKTSVSRITTEAAEAILNISFDSIVESSQPDPKASAGEEMANRAQCNDFDEDLMFEDWDFSSQNLCKLLVLDTMKRCTITEIQASNHEKSINVQLCEDESAQTICKLRESWYHANLAVGNIVNIVAEFKHDEWVVDNSSGLLILSPDMLISGTTLMGSMFCRRRAILASAFPTVEAGAKCMIIGSSVHLLLQKVMQNNIRCNKKIQQIIEEIVSDPGLIHQLLMSNMEFEEMKNELENFSPKVLDFMETYVFPKRGTPAKFSYVRRVLTIHIHKSSSGDTWNGKITSIKDIEENIWSPTFGMKGKVDVTVEANAGGEKKIMPFELKTGRSSNSAEHRGQVILYVMMMAQLGYDTDSGLLFYLRDGQMKEVRVDHKVKRDIMMMRNDFVYNILASQTVEFQVDGSISGPILPEPINHHSACAKCPYLTICCASLAEDGMRGVHPKNSLTSLAATTLGHLKSSHVSYVFHWAGLLKIEEEDKKSRNASSMKDLWCLSADEREQNGMCAANLSLTKVDHISDIFIHVFRFQNQSISNNFSIGDYVIISSELRPAVVTGSILNISEHDVSISLDKDLSLREDKVFHMDRYESQTLLNFNMSSLCALLNDSKRADELRQAVVELKLPCFRTDLPDLSTDLKGRLNDGQKKAVLRAFAAESYMLIEGMPGCGKTETLAALVKLLVKYGKSVLVTSHTHSAVDNLALRLLNLDLLRLGKKTKINPLLHKFSEEVLLSKPGYKTVEEVRQLYLSKSVVAVTVLGCSHPIFSFRRFDVCIVDEATQVLQPSTFKPLIAADKFILVGDPLQLPPLVLSNTARSLGLSESLFVRLSRPAVTVVLNTQYRMNKQITSLANQFMYQGALRCANETVANNTLNLSTVVSDHAWLERALSCRLEHSVVFVNVRDSSANSETIENPTEAKVLMVVLEALKNKGVSDESIGVIAAYRAQVNLLGRLTMEKKFKIEVNTIDQYQGRDKDIILFSCSARANASDGGILSSKQRLSVAITRAKQKLIFFGNLTLLKSYKTFEQILECIGDDCVVRA